MESDMVLMDKNLEKSNPSLFQEKNAPQTNSPLELSFRNTYKTMNKIFCEPVKQLACRKIKTTTLNTNIINVPSKMMPPTVPTLAAIAGLNATSFEHQTPYESTTPEMALL